MRKSITIITSFLLAVLFAFTASASEPVVKVNGVVKGMVRDAQSNQPIEYATVAVFKTGDDKPVNGTITDDKGFFSMTGIDAGVYKVTISFIGYEAKTVAKIEITSKKREVMMGKITLKPATQDLGEVNVVSDRAPIQYKIDKKVVNVSQMHSAASGTATDILENVPSVSVDVEGTVSLRGSTSFTVLIDNKPTILEASDVLSQIPASAIENIEIITNPSAKYDPEGSAGIINIITKKNRLQGISGLANINLGRSNKYGGDLLLSYRTKKLNVYASADYNHREHPGSLTTKRTTFRDGYDIIIGSQGDRNRLRDSYGIKGGLDWTPTKNDNISFAARYGGRAMGSNSFTDYTEEYTNLADINKYRNNEITDRGGQFYSLTGDYTHKFAKKGHKISAQLVYNNRAMDEYSLSELSNLTNVVQSGQESTESGPMNKYRAKIDYTLPVTASDKIEAGYQIQNSISTDDNRVLHYNTATQVYELQPNYSSASEYTQQTQSVYALYAGELGKLGYQGGVRGEYTYRYMELFDLEQDFEVDEWQFFPSAHISYQLPAKQQLMASYTRRIKRPRGWYLEPFVTWQSAYSVRQGNPELLPQGVDSYELSYQKRFGRNFVSAEVYHKVTHDKIERVQSVYEGYESVILQSFANVGKDYSTGTELMLSLDTKKWVHVDIMGNFYNYRIEGVLLGEEISQSSNNWNSRLNFTFKLPKNMRFQMNGMYYSPSVSAQGRREGFVMTNTAFKAEFFNRKLTTTLQLRDILATGNHEFSSYGPGFKSDVLYERQPRMLSLTLSYKINNYKQKRGKGGRGGDDMDMDGGGEF